ncbi:cupin domain-containing protein [Hymenobacter psoromatis]|uniref:cupin domain-containing protein n=1 Tax=Hymenobacter psoromatis TaxID=1484116 RepID=UPI001CBCE10F|nr:cupin domain-containing protein [Hymenobacter psoromatis]
MPAFTTAFHPATDLTWQPAGPGIRRSLLATNQELMLVKSEFEAGALGPLQQHPQSRISYVESGEFTVTVGDETRILRTGDTFYAAPNVPHGVVARQAGALLDTFSPPHEELLPPTR